jgi:NAD(P)-dependent dehydrogenase (short-subunit alcohol dehydrogenase family)
MDNYATFKDLEDTSVFITGGGSGIGASITKAFCLKEPKWLLFRGQIVINF